MLMNKKYMRDIILKGVLLLAGTLTLCAARAQENRAPGFDNTQAVDTLPETEPAALFAVQRSLSTSAIQSVKGSDLYHTPAANLTNTLYGRLPGLMVLQGSGEPGYDGASLRIRGAGTFNDQNMAIFVDGFQTNIDYF